jgi:hypothetical protein
MSIVTIIIDENSAQSAIEAAAAQQTWKLMKADL